ncbi:uncharacterized protein LOC124912438 [Impatiens glandulifera]|uniref:uncharacterized protein LOC124912438 n=1 Tax=Impatiens glandulifera TaxID=253017 RepID=UPI001FB07E2F|nr:uncharacterized protein LOC124912438 [Impatiens glandulifera]
MGNCLVTQEKVIKVMKTDGKVLEYKAPIKVHEVLSDFAGHAISDRLPVIRHLQPDAVMVSNHLYYLLPLPKLSEQRREKKKVRFAVPEVETCQEGGVVRIKLVITKQELEIMLRGGVSVDDMLSHDQEQRKHQQKVNLNELHVSTILT